MLELLNEVHLCNGGAAEIGVLVRSTNAVAGKCRRYARTIGAPSGDYCVRRRAGTDDIGCWGPVNRELSEQIMPSEGAAVRACSAKLLPSGRAEFVSDSEGSMMRDVMEGKEAEGRSAQDTVRGTAAASSWSCTEMDTVRGSRSQWTARGTTRTGGVDGSGRGWRGRAALAALSGSTYGGRTERNVLQREAKAGKEAAS